VALCADASNLVQDTERAKRDTEYSYENDHNCHDPLASILSPSQTVIADNIVESGNGGSSPKRNKQRKQLRLNLGELGLFCAPWNPTFWNHHIARSGSVLANRVASKATTPQRRRA
jgi:hypothetical protein